MSKETKSMIFDHRTYTIKPNRLAKFLETYERLALPLQREPAETAADHQDEQHQRPQCLVPEHKPRALHQVDQRIVLLT